MHDSIKCVFHRGQNPDQTNYIVSWWNYIKPNWNYVPNVRSFWKNNVKRICYVMVGGFVDKVERNAKKKRAQIGTQSPIASSVCMSLCVFMITSLWFWFSIKENKQRRANNITCMTWFDNRNLDYTLIQPFHCIRQLCLSLHHHRFQLSKQFILEFSFCLYG